MGETRPATSPEYTCDCLANYVVAREGENVSFNITSKFTFFAKNDTNIFYLRNKNKLMIFNNKYGKRIQYDAYQTAIGGHFSFTLLNVTSSDAGLFECRTIEKSEDCLLLVISREPTQPDVKGDSEFPVAGNQMTLTCNSTSRSLPSDHPLVMGYRWKKNGNIFKTQAYLTNFALNVRKADMGDNYSCQAYEGGLASPWSLAFTLQPQYGPDSIEISSTSVLDGDHVTCSADCNPGCNIYITGSVQDGQGTTGQVAIRMDRSQSLIYCRAWNEHGKISRFFYINVLYGPDSIKISSTSVLDGDHVTCSADCNPGCNITGSGQDGQVTTGQVAIRMDRSRPLIFCRAWNEHGKISRIFYINVLFPPELSCEDGNKTTHEGRSLTITWVVNSNPESNVTIHSPNGTGVPMTTLEEIRYHSYNISYTIDNAKCDDHGLYEITAENQYGSTNSSVAVIVLCSPRLFHKPKPVKTPDNNTWSFMIQAYPEPTMEGIFSMSPGRDTQAIGLPHKRIPHERQTEDELTTRSNLHEFHVKFPCESLGEKYLLTFINTEGKKNISFFLEEDHCEESTDATVVITVVNVTIILVLILLTSGFVIYRRKKSAGARRHGPPRPCDTTRNNRFRQENATVPRKTERPVKDVDAKVKEPTGKPVDRAGNKNEDGLLYVDNDLLPSTLKNGTPVIIFNREETVYEDIDFTETPGPQHPDNIVEVEQA